MGRAFRRIEEVIGQPVNPAPTSNVRLSMNICIVELSTFYL
jgi:hypothetical protein